MLVPRREMGWSNSIRYGGAGTEPVARVHPVDAAAAGIADGAQVRVRSAHGTVVATVALDDTVVPGVVSYTHGRRDSSPGTLVSGSVDVDPLTAMPHASGFVVTLGVVDR